MVPSILWQELEEEAQTVIVSMIWPWTPVEMTATLYMHPNLA
jgi:hypothetical protein